MCVYLQWRLQKGKNLFDSASDVLYFLIGNCAWRGVKNKRESMRESRVFTVILLAFLACILFGGLHAAQVRADEADEDVTVVADLEQSESTPSPSAPIPMTTLTVTPNPERKLTVTPRPTRVPTVTPTRVPGLAVGRGLAQVQAPARVEADPHTQGGPNKPTPTVPALRMPDVVGMHYQEAKSYLTKTLTEAGFTEVHVVFVWVENYDHAQDYLVQEQIPMNHAILNLTESSVTVKLYVAAQGPIPMPEMNRVAIPK